MSSFHFKHFSVLQTNSAMKVGTDAMILGAFIHSQGRKLGLDIGAGTGVISLMVVQGNDTIEIDAIEIDSLSVEECETNFKDSPWSSRLNVLLRDFKLFYSEKEYDLIFSNPPYYATTNLSLDRRVSLTKHEESLPSEIILQKVSDLLSNSGDFWVIAPFSEKNKWVTNAKIHGLYLRKSISIQGKSSKDPNRVILTFNRVSAQVDNQKFIVRKENGWYSDEYIELTKDFHSLDLSLKEQGY